MTARFGLLLGGGGSVGIAWENGVLAGLVDAIGFEPARSTVIVGTSAGSAVGADMALGKDPHDALALDRASDSPRPKLPPPDLEQGVFAEIIALMMSPAAGTPETVASGRGSRSRASARCSSRTWRPCGRPACVCTRSSAATD